MDLLNHIIDTWNWCHFFAITCFAYVAIGLSWKVSDSQREDIKEFWFYVMGNGSHLNLFGKILFFPLISVTCIGYTLLVLLFQK